MRKMLESDLQLSGNGVSAGNQDAGVQANAYGQGQLDQLDDSHIEVCVGLHRKTVHQLMHFVPVLECKLSIATLFFMHQAQALCEGVALQLQLAAALALSMLDITFPVLRNMLDAVDVGLL